LAYPDIASPKKLWYLAETDRDLADSLNQTVINVKTSQRWQEALNVRHLRMYGGLSAVKSALGFAAAWGELSRATSSPIQGPSFNLIYSISDTIVAKNSKNRPRAEFITDGGDYREQRKAKKLNKMSLGLFYQCNFYAMLRDVIRDACVFGTGVIKVFERDGNVQTERVFPNDIWVDLLEGANQSPANMFQTSLVDKQVLRAMFPDKTYEISMARGFTVTDEKGISSNLGNFVEVREGWHLRSGPDADDGRHAITIDGVCLEDGKWNVDWFPFQFFRFSPPILTFWGRGVAELITPHQAELNRVCRVEAQSHRLMSVPRVWADYASGIDISHLQSNKPMSIGFYRNGLPPVAFNWNATTENFVQYKQWIKRDAFEFVGVSMLAASSKIPSGVESAVAIREVTDIEADRFLALGQQVDEFAVEVAKLQINTAREIYRRNGSFEVATVGRKFLETIDWGDIDLEEDSYYVKAHPASSLTQTPAARKQFIVELLQSQQIQPEDALHYFDNPDIEELTALYDAASEDIDAVVDGIIYDGKWEQPDAATQYLQLGVKRANQAYLLGKHSGVPQANLDMILEWMGEARGELQRIGLMPPDQVPQDQQPAPVAGPAPIPQGMPAQPEQAPVSPMIPIPRAA
jgi:hypothetical protein